jgi:glycosyltransferase involved in cell wall biosynthesis
MDDSRTYSVLANALNHPDAINPYQCLWNYRILRSLAKTGVDLDVVSPRPFAPPVGPYSEYASLPDVEDWGTYAVHHPRFWYLLPKRLFYGLAGNSYAKRIPDYVERTFDVPDVVHACHIFPDGYGMLPYVREHDLPLFVVSHGNLVRTIEDQPLGVAPKIRETLDAATGVLCVSDKLAAKARKLTDPSKVETVPIGAEPDRFPVDQRQRLRRELDIAPDATVVLFVGRFIRRKGIPELTEVLPQLDLEDTVFAFVGHDTEMLDELEDAIRESQFSNRYVFTGVTSLALRRWFAVADLLVLPSRAEGRPTVVYEAMASETPVLSTTVGGIPEQVADGETGVLVPPRDPDSLQDALESLTADPDHLERMGEASLRRLHDRDWTWSDHAARVRELHLEAIGEKAVQPAVNGH